MDGGEVVGTAYPAPVAKTGQTTSYAAGDDGDLQKGVTPPSPRFTDNGDGTVTDNLTGLIWLQDVACLWGGGDWATVLDTCNNLANGDCGLGDDSIPGDWRLPNVKELLSLVDYSQGFIKLPLTTVFFTDPLFPGSPYYHWTSTSKSPTGSPGELEEALALEVRTGELVSLPKKTMTYIIFAVRDGS